MSASRSNLKIDIEAMTKISTEILIYGRYVKVWNFYHTLFMWNMLKVTLC